MKKYVKLTTSLKERLLFLFTGIISKDSVKIVKPGKRDAGRTYTHYPVLPDPQEAPKPYVPDKPTPAPRPPRKKAVPKPKPTKAQAPIGVYVQEKMPDIPFFDLNQDNVKSNL